MQNSWKDKRLELITLGIFFILLLTSLFFLYDSYNHYSLLVSTEQTDKAFVHEIVMLISVTILFFSLFIFYTKRDYFFVEKENDIQALENLFEEIKGSFDELKIQEFKHMLNEKNHTEIYSLISNMIIELQESKKAIDEADKVKTLFLSNMSHEIRTPITGVMAFTNFLSSTKLDNEQKEFVNIIQKSSEELLGVVNNILDVTKLENGRLELTQSTFNIGEEFEKFIDTYAIDALKKNIDFSVWIDPELLALSINSDIEKIKQILINLISNAIKFSNNNGSLELSLKKINLNSELVTVQFMVKDRGIGMSEEQQRTVFKLFNQADNSDTRAYRGVGLGLTIVNNLVNMLDGTLMLESELDKGSKFSFALEMPYEECSDRKSTNPLSVVIYAPEEAQEKIAYKHLVAYLSSVKGLSLNCFQTFVECKSADLDSFDVLYLYYDEMNLEELKRVVAQYSSEKQVILLSKLSNRETILDILPIFSQLIYEPITLPKIEKSLEIIDQNNKLFSLKVNENYFDLKALVVEDNLINQKVMVHTLKSIGVESDVAENGQVGVEMFKQKQYNMVFMDIQMPVMNGVAATKHILEYEVKYNLDHTPIVAVTTNNLKGDRELYLQSGMDDYISKPISTHKFVTVIKQFYTANSKRSSENSPQKRDILLYKTTATDAKILTTLLTTLDYSVDVAKNREELHYKMKRDDHKLCLLDKSSTQKEDEVLMSKISEHKRATLFFLDKKSILTADEMNSYTQVMYKTANFSDVQVQVEKMMEL